MGTLVSVSDLVNRLTGGGNGTPERVSVWKDFHVSGAAAAPPIAQRMLSLWQYEGSPSHGAAPGAVVAPTNATDGALKQTNPSGGRTKYLVSATLGVQATGTVVLYDRLLHISGLSGTNVGAQTVGGAITRYVSGVGNQIWVEVYTQIGGSSTTITASYTNTVPTSGRTSQAVAIGNTGFREAQRLLPLSLVAGDLGVAAVASVTLAGTTGTIGDFGVTVVHPLMTYPVGLLGAGSTRDSISGLNLLGLEDSACLALAFTPNVTTTPQFIGLFTFVEI